MNVLSARWGRAAAAGLGGLVLAGIVPVTASASPASPGSAASPGRAARPAAPATRHAGGAGAGVLVVGCRGTWVITPTEFVLNCASARHRPHRAHGADRSRDDRASGGI